MKSTTTLIILGVLIALLPISGLPGSWRNILCIIFGLSVAGIVFYNVHKTKSDTTKSKIADELEEPEETIIDAEENNEQ